MSPVMPTTTEDVELKLHESQQVITTALMYTYFKAGALPGGGPPGLTVVGAGLTVEGAIYDVKGINNDGNVATGSLTLNPCGRK
jgi:hypothetical protein